MKRSAHATFRLPAVTSPALLVLPIKAFDNAKGRLANVLGLDQRIRLARECASRVAHAAEGCDILVVTGAVGDTAVPHPEILDWATHHGAACITQSEPGLNAAVRDGVRFAIDRSYPTVVIAHSDIPLATPVVEFVEADTIVIVPDAKRDGTNLMSLPIAVAERYDFRYGPGSFRAHRDEARRLGHEPRIIASREWGLDLDTPEDLRDSRLRDALPWLFETTKEDS
jgi:2-phospho-L-lactate guanylyltransferase